LGLEAVSCVGEADEKQLIHLITNSSTQKEDPVLLIVEQLLMNTRLDSLAKVLIRVSKLPTLSHI